MADFLYNSLGSALRKRFGCRVHKITIDAGFTCPNRDGTVGRGGCIYCNARGSGTGASAHSSITEQIQNAKAFLRQRYKAEKFIAYFQSFSNTYGPVNKLRSLYEEALSDEDVVGLAVGTRPDCVSEDVLDFLAELNKRTYISLEYGLQSIHDRTLERINRGHDSQTFRNAVVRTRKRGIDITVHVILGLSGENRHDMLETAQALGGMDIQAVKIHLLYVLRNTPLHSMFESGEYQCLTRESYVDIIGDFLALLPPHIIIQRLTSDPHSDELVAPAWSLEKNTNLKAIRDALINRNLWQGKCYKIKKFH